MKKLDTKKKEMAKKMGEGQKGFRAIQEGMEKYHKNLKSFTGKGNYKKHLDKEYKEEDNFTTRKGE